MGRNNAGGCVGNVWERERERERERGKKHIRNKQIIKRGHWKT